jgi:uncharacterized protein
MKWRGRERSSNVEDRRGAPGGRGGLGRAGGANPFGRGGMRLPVGRRGGGIGGVIGIIVVLGIIWFATGQNPLDMMAGGTNPGAPSQSAQSRPLPQAGQDELADFVAVVLKENEDLWEAVFAQNNLSYTPPTLVLFTDQTQSACGLGDAQIGPFYCPQDNRIYIDLSFYDQLRDRFGAPGDFAQAYVLAHEVGHHIQNLTGVLPEFNRARAQMSPAEANQYSVRVELQADCYAGVWANYAGQQNLLESGDIEEAVNAASQIGDDAIQVRTQGFAVPKTFSHGTSEQRRSWFERGFSSGDVGQCDTFSAGSV